MSCPFKIFSQYLNAIQVKHLILPLQNLTFASFEPFRGELACMLHIIVLLHNPTASDIEHS